MNMVQFLTIGKTLADTRNLFKQILNRLKGENIMGSRLLSPEEVASELISRYYKNKKRYMIEVNDFKSIANRKQLKDGFLWEVDEELRKRKYCLIDLREFNNCIAIIRVATILNSWDTLEED